MLAYLTAAIWASAEITLQRRRPGTALQPRVRSRNRVLMTGIRTEATGGTTRSIYSRLRGAGELSPGMVANRPENYEERVSKTVVRRCKRPFQTNYIVTLKIDFKKREVGSFAWKGISWVTLTCQGELSFRFLMQQSFVQSEFSLTKTANHVSI